MYLCQISLFDQKRSQPHSAWTQFRLEVLCHGLMAAKSLLDFYMSLPLRAEMTFNNSQWIQIGFALTLASKLSVESSDAAIYDQTAEYRDSLRMSSILRNAILRTQVLITPHTDVQGDRDVFYHYEQRLKHLQWWHDSIFSESFSASFQPAHRSSPLTSVPSSSLLDIPSTTPINEFHENTEWPTLAPNDIHNMLANWIPDLGITFDDVF